MNKFGLTEEDDTKIGQNYPGGDHDFSYQDLEESNITDAENWFVGGEMVAIVSEIHGGIIGYVHRAHADDITTVLNLHAIDRLRAK